MIDDFNRLDSIQATGHEAYNKEVSDLPWQLSLGGIILGLFLGLIPFVIALVGNLQVRNNNDSPKMYVILYNICLALNIIILLIILNL